ncbi:DNA/RNA non-specific endonuclease [Butyrivibrio sp. MC2013]|uniref:DNA/RNA non-specific endonuclease n=1 Tax=Butyrivibrio sp. MC2013 TaxID=1280686 RepID=UPI0003F5FC66|nr:DNA/RNA non-specific endonuclease [Butyrivibrio sp. MC2013]
MKVFNRAKNRLLTRILTLVVSISVVLIMSGSSACASNSIPTYSGIPAVQINKNIPSFAKKEIISESYETYGELDKLGRCTQATACIGTDLMPTEKRGSIGMVKPTGWNQNKYPGIVDSEPPYLYNRCHLIGFQLTGENANEKNLITGTRYFNIDGMLPYENIVADYVKNTGNHVLYRVTPYYEKDNLLCSGVQIEALSVEDSGKGVSFNVFCYNVQPGVLINYKDGSNKLDENYVVEAVERKQSAVEETKSEKTKSNTQTSYVANKNTKKFHYASCGSVNDMKEKNKLYYDGSRDDLVKQGYTPCKRCNP